MNDVDPSATPSALFLDGMEAKDLMTPKVVTIPASASVAEAVSLLMEKDLHAVPVTDEKGEPIGVLSRTDILGYDHRFDPNVARQVAENVGVTAMPGRNGNGEILGDGSARVRDLMTRVVYAVTPNSAAKTVVDAMLTLGIHRLFVTGQTGDLLGVISATDILRHLHEPAIVTFENVEILMTGSGGGGASNREGE